MKAGKINKKKDDQVELTGKVIKKKFGAGSKSEHDAVYIQTDEGEYVLKRMGGNPFHDPILHKLIGRKITASGLLQKYNFIVKEFKENDSDELTKNKRGKTT